MLVVGLTFIVFIVCVTSSVSDVRGLRIPNLHSVIVLVAFVLGFAISPDSFGPWWSHLTAFVVFFIISYVLFCLGMFGGGDAKLGSSLALWTGLKGFMPYMFYMALVGGILGAVALAIKKMKPIKNPREGSWVAEVQSGKNAVPYGIAISVGAFGALFHTGFLHHQLDELMRIIN